jgi:uncharacterized protein YjbI with pentapeptide repeats
LDVLGHTQTRVPEEYCTSLDLYEANLQRADLRKADLQEANLLEANVTDEQLAYTRSLQGATMPDGQEYEDWLKSKGSREDG